MPAKKFINYFEHLQKHEKLTKTQFFFVAFGILLFLSLAITLPNYLLKKQQISNSMAAAAIPGQSSLICTTQAAQQLTSPWTYHALSSGSQTYTVAQYQALPGYGTTLPPLPTYISGQGASAPAAVIFAPGSTVSQPGYTYPASPMLFFFEGGAYGTIEFQATSGGQYIGGSAPGFPEPTFDNGGTASGISAQNDSYGSGNSTTALATLTSAASQGATTISLSASSMALVQWGQVRIGTHIYTVSSVTGSQSGYTIGIDRGLDVAEPSGTGVYYDGMAGGVTVSYLDIAHDAHNTTGTIYTGAGWIISHNNIHDGGTTPGQGVAIYGGDQGIIEYNCISKMGDYAANIFGTNNKLRDNEIFDTSYAADPGCGCSGAGKWWGTLNADITDNAFIDDGPGGEVTIWLDNGNAGTLISGNYFSRSYESAVHSETGYNLNITNNLFENGGWGTGTGGCGNNCNGAVNINHSGGWHIPNSRYDNQLIVANNQFINNWEGISIWQSGARSCENSGEGWPEDASYCSGGFPVSQLPSSNGQYYFSHFGNTTNQGANALVEPSSIGSTVIMTKGAMAINDQIGFSDPAITTTSSTTNVTTLNGAGTMTVASTSNFPSSGQLRVGTSAAWNDGGGSYTGAILSYTGKTSTTFTGVALVRGSGTLAGPVWQVQPYKVVSQTCYANDCAVTISPALTSSLTAGTAVTNAGTCQLFATSAATPTSPTSPDGHSYWDGCQWETNNISISGNTFVFDPTTIAASAPLTGGTTTNCTASHPNGCGINFMAFQPAGEAPFSGQAGANAMMSNSNLTGCPSWDPGCSTNPLRNINALANPPGAPAGNGATPHNIVWSNNSYSGPWQWNTYIFGNCSSNITDSTTGHTIPSGACTPDFLNWQSSWQQESGSTYSVTPVYPSGAPTAAPTPTPTGTGSKTATINASPASQSVTVGNSFSVSISVNGGGTAFNAAQANIAVSPNLSVTNFSPGNCNFSYSGTPPSVQNLSFSGAILSSSSTLCTVYTVTFQALSSGTGTITLTNGSVKAYSDSSELLSSVTNGTYTLTVVPTATPSGSGPTIPQNLRTTSVSSTSVNLAWDPSTDTLAPLSGYDILRNGVSIGTTGSTNITDNTTVAGQTYTYTVYAYDSAFNHSPNSAPLNVTIPGANTPTPVPPTATVIPTPTPTIVLPTPTPTPSPATRKPADFNNDGVIDATDLSIFAVDWLRTTANLANPYTDINKDGIVDLTDFSLFAKNYGQ